MTEPNWLLGAGSGFGRYSAADDYMHPNAIVPGDSLTETWAYMWYVPEAQISCFAYVWTHPNLEVVTGGLMVWQGHKHHHLASELFDIRAYSSMARVGIGADIEFENGVRIEILEPLQRIRIRHRDEARENEVDVTLTAASPPAMRESEKHFDQVMRAQGTMRLRRKTHQVDGFGMRDRSWGELRPEQAFMLPPYDWMTATFPETGLSWLVCAHDDPTRNPVWTDSFVLPPEEAFKEGWIHRDGSFFRVTHASALTDRDPRSGRPKRHQVTLTDISGRSYDMNGKVIASVPWSPWPNVVGFVCLTQWECEGQIGYGDTQDLQWTDFVSKFTGSEDHRK